MPSLAKVNCADDYSNAATIEGVSASNGGWFNVSGNDAFVELEYGPPGQRQWKTEELVPVGTAGGNGVIAPGTTGIRFRNAVAGSVAVVSAGIATHDEPPLTLQASGQAASTKSSVITGIIPAAGTTPTAGTGFTYTHTNGTGIYVFTFTTAFVARPVILCTANEAALLFFQVSAISASGFTVTITNSVGATNDHAFNFTAQAVV